MKSYTVHEPPKPKSDRLDRAEDLVFIKDGFNVLAFVIAPVWLLANRLWLVLFFYVVLQAGLQLVFGYFGTGNSIRSAIAIGLNALVGFEADSLKRWTFARRGWAQVGTVTGDTFDICQRRFFEDWLQRTPAVDTGSFDGFESEPIRGRGLMSTTAATASATDAPAPKRPSRIGPWRSA